MESSQRDISNETEPANQIDGLSAPDEAGRANRRDRQGRRPKRSRRDKRDSGIDMLNGPLPGKI